MPRHAHPACMTAAATVFLLLLALPYGAEGQEEPSELRTYAELSGFTEYTPYDSMMVYLDRVQARSTEMRLGIYGATHQGRELPYAIFSRPAVTQPWEAWALGKPILVLAAGVHGPERTLRESVLILTRELATPGTLMNDLLDDLVVLVVPQINPDGFSHRPSPQRGNTWGLDLNRDYVKLEQPEIQGYVQNVILRWAPHLYVDGHNGGSYPYNLNYQCPSHASPAPEITALCDSEIFPAIDRKVEAEDYRTFYYVRGNETRWDVGGTEPRIGRNYGGFANTVAILFESPGRQEMVDGVRSGVLAYEAVLEWSRDNGDLLMETVRRARVETVEMGSEARGQVAIETEYEPEDWSVEYLIARGEGEAEEIVAIQSDSLMKKPVPVLERDRPWAYLLPRDAEDAVALLRRHSVQVELLREPVDLEVQAYTIGDITYESAYNHDAATRVHVRDVVTTEVTFPAGTYVVRTGQMQGRVAAHLLEAESTDGVVYWNRMDAWIPKAELDDYRRGEVEELPYFPIMKLMEATPLPTRLIPPLPPQAPLR
ncbi:MAG: M14 family zinc carboxypeptidase [Gemmatimonadota bacterium]